MNTTEKQSEQVSTWITPAARQKLNKLAVDEGRSVANVIRRLILQAVKETA